MRAIVFSGGGNRGPLQVGAMRALLEREIRPEMIVGCSAGALNASFMATSLTMERLDQLADVWLGTTRENIYPGNRMSALWRIVTRKDSFFDNANFYEFLQRTGTTPAQTFGSIKDVELYITATELAGGTLHVFGDDPGDLILDALMASTALPPVHPPWEVDGRRYIDGGTITPLPLRVALDRGATEIYALHLRDSKTEENNLVRGVMNVMGHSVNTMLRLQADHDRFLMESRPNVKFHYVQLTLPDPPGEMDFSQAQRMMDAGYEIMTGYLDKIPGARRQNVPAETSAFTQMGNRLRRLWARSQRAHPGIPDAEMGLETIPSTDPSTKPGTRSEAGKAADTVLSGGGAPSPQA